MGIVLFSDWSSGDYEYLLNLIAWHKVAPAFLKHCNDKKLKDVLPLPFWRSLIKLTQSCRYLSLAQVSVLSQLSAELNAASINFLYLKGVVMSAFLYHDLHARHSKDIDLWVSDDCVEGACKAILAAGFLLVKPAKPLGEINFKRYMNVQKDMVFMFDGNLSIELELHWRLDKNRYVFALQFSDAYAQRMMVDIGGTACPTLSMEHSFLYLCMHGSMAMYGRLKWLLDARQGLARVNQRVESQNSVSLLSQQLKQELSIRFTKTLMIQTFGEEVAGIHSHKNNACFMRILTWIVLQNIKNAAYLSLLPRWVLRFFLFSGGRFKFEQLRLAVLLFRRKFLVK